MKLRSMVIFSSAIDKLTWPRIDGSHNGEAERPPSWHHGLEVEEDLVSRDSKSGHISTIMVDGEMTSSHGRAANDELHKDID